MYFLVERIKMCQSEHYPTPSVIPDIMVTATPDTLPPSPPVSEGVAVYDIQAVTPVSTERRISLDPAGFDVVANEDDNSGIDSEKTIDKIGNAAANFYVQCCGCNGDNGTIGGGNDYKDKQEDYYEEEERVQIPESSSTKFSFRKLWAFTGPGLLMSIGYLDPGNIESDLQSGAAAKYQLLWVLLWATIIGLLVQRLAARLGTVSGLHLAEACHRHYSIVPRYTLWLLAETAVIGAEMQEVIGSAIAIYLLSNTAIPLWAGVIISVFQSLALLLVAKYGMRKLEAVFALMIAVMAASFGYEYAKVAPNQVEVMKGMLLPGCLNCDKSALLQGVGIIGSVIMPHNLFLHSTLVKSRDIDRSKPIQLKEANKYFFIEASIALMISFIINLFTVSVFANGMWKENNEQQSVRKTNGDILQLCLAQGQQPQLDSMIAMFSNDTGSIFQPNIYTGGIFLGCQYGKIAMYIWAIGILAAGQSSTMTATYAGQFIMEGFLNLKLPRWKRSLVTRFVIVLPPFMVAKFLQIDDLSQMNDLLNASMSLILPFALLPLISMTNMETLMGKFSNGTGMKVFSCTLVACLVSINMYFVSSYFVSNVSKPMDGYAGLTVVGFGVLYVSMCTYLFCHVVLSMGFSPWSVEAVTKVMIVMVVNIVILILTYLIAF